MAAVLEIKVRKVGLFGAEIEGIDLARLSNAEADAIKAAWYRHDVIFFRNQRLTDDDLLAFSRHFGTLDPPPNQGAGRKSPPGYPDVYIVSNVLDVRGEPIGALGDGEAAWHTDMSYLPHPPDASMLYSLEIPARGGDTCFASMKLALAKMPKALLERIVGLEIKHDGTYDSGGNLRKGLAASNDPRTSVGTAHPIVIEHPVSGEPALYLGRRRNAYVMGLELAESERVLEELWSFVETTVYRHRWALGDQGLGRAAPREPTRASAPRATARLGSRHLRTCASPRRSRRP